MLDVKIIGTSVKYAFNSDTPISVRELEHRIEEQTVSCRSNLYFQKIFFNFLSKTFDLSLTDILIDFIT